MTLLLRPAAILAFAVSAAAAPLPDNNVPLLNPGFEDAAGAAGWGLQPPVYTMSTDRPRTGKHCLRFENSNADKYVLCSQSIQLEVGKQYEFEVWVRTENVRGEDTGATICVQWWTKDGKFIGGAYPSGIKGTTTEWTRISARTSQIPEGAARFDITCYVRKKMTGVAYWDDVAIRRYRPPLVEALVTDAYRNAVTGGKVTVKAGLALEANGAAPDTISATLSISTADGAEVAALSPIAVTETDATFEVDAAPLSPGVYDLVCDVRTADGHATRASSKLRRLAEVSARRAFVDRHGRLILGGKPFFPLGTYWGGINEEHLHIYAKSPFNCLMPYGRPNREQLDLAQSRDLKVIYSIKDLYHGTKWCPKHITSPEDERPAIEKIVTEFRDHPAVMAWYINDELPLSMVDRLAEHRDWVEELDPGHPAWVVLYQVDQIRSYLPTFDVIGTDPYPIPAKPASMALDYTRKTVGAGFGYRAVWMVPQIFNWAAYGKPAENSRAPTLLEMRSMAWQCIVGGANGLVFYSWMDLWRMDKTVEDGGRAVKREPFEERWRDVTAMAKEIEELIPVLLSVEESRRPQAVEATAGVAWRLYGKDGATYVAIVNSSDAPGAASLVFDADLASADAVLGDDGAESAGKRLSLLFSPLEPKVVRLVFAE